jgi:hypothetical protein
MARQPSNHLQQLSGENQQLLREKIKWHKKGASERKRL